MSGMKITSGAFPVQVQRSEAGEKDEEKDTEKAKGR